MPQRKAYLFAILMVVAIAAGCRGSQSGFEPIPSQNSERGGARQRQLPSVIKVLFAGYSRKRHRLGVHWWGWIDTKTGRRITLRKSKISPAWTTQPTPTPGWGTCSGSGGNYCFQMIPGGYLYGERLWCNDCSPSSTVTGYVGTNYGHTPPPGYTITGSSTTQPSVNCNSGCTLTTCGSPYPTCWVNIVLDASGVDPANTNDTFCLFTPSPANPPSCPVFGVISWVTILPTVLDLKISSGSQTVNWNGESPVVLPSPVMVGQQVELQPSPAAIASAQWAFDSTANSSVVGDYTLKDNIASSGPTAIPAVPSPSPVPTSGSPIAFYWISSVGTVANGIRYVRVTGLVSGVTGPLFADVYYPVGTPSPSVTASPNTVALPTNYPEVINGVPYCSVQTYTAIALGNPCSTVGIAWQYSTGVPSYGGGSIAMTQIANSIKISASGTPSPNPRSSDGSGLDDKFPYASAVSTNTTWGSNDSPAFPLITPPACSSVTLTDSFTDYFMYQPGVTTSRSGSRLWVTVGTMPWNFSGTAYHPGNSISPLYSLIAGDTVNPTPSYSPSTTLPTWTQLYPPGRIGC